MPNCFFCSLFNEVFFLGFYHSNTVYILQGGYDIQIVPDWLSRRRFDLRMILSGGSLDC